MDMSTREIYSVERSTSPQPMYLRDLEGARRHAFRFKGKVPVTIQHQGATHTFETINYSEIGMLIVPVDPPVIGFSAGATVEGIIGVGAMATAFRGVVLRIDEGKRVALKIVVKTGQGP